MMQKKIGVLIRFLFLIMLVGVVSADSCSITERNSCNDGIVMGLSSLTNAHGEVYNQNNYDYVLCCDFTGTHTCDGNNKIVGLSSVTNAHAEIPENSNYGINVCFGNMECESVTGPCPSGKETILSLSDNTNAHIGPPSYYAKQICCDVETSSPPPLDECELTSAVWSTTNAVEGDTVFLIVTGDNCYGKEISFEILEDDPFPLPDQPVITNPANVVFNGNSVSGTWVAEWQEDFSGDPEYFFIAKVVGEDEAITSSTQLENELTVSKKIYSNCTDIFLCGNYDTEEECNNDNCDVADEMNIPNIDCDDPNVICECSWTSGMCAFSWTVRDSYCGDGVINTGETCDGDEWGPISGCSSFDEFTGGILECVNCQFDTSQCDGGNGPGICGDGVINTGETCDGDEWGPISGCSSFDEFTGGILECVNCQFDTSQCTKGSGDTITPGKCNYFENSENDDCEDGTYTYSWDAIIYWPSDNYGWSDSSGCISSGGEDSSCVEFLESIEPNFDGLWHYDPIINDVNLLFTECRGGSYTRECPAQVKLSFFGWETFLATLIILGAIYWVWNSKKKRKVSKKKR
jgi:hypothetical protein